MSNYTLLTVGNPKTAKGAKYGYATAILHLAPGSLSGRNVCPKATEGCLAACLNTAGRGGIFAKGETTNAIQKARIRRTQWLYADRAGFVATLCQDIAKFAAWCAANDMKPALRLNGTSDLDWQGIAPSVVDLCARLGVQRYDYTKVATRIKREHAGYRLTFSLAENNDSDARQWLANGGNVAVVFRSKALPATFMGAPVIDGDDSDLRFLDPRGVVVGLYAKGKAKRDTSGFVRDAEPSVMHNARTLYE